MCVSVIGIVFKTPDIDMAILDDVECKSHKTYPSIFSSKLDIKPTKSSSYKYDAAMNPFSIKSFIQIELPVPTSLNIAGLSLETIPCKD